jgi:hypothetical protein
MPAIRLGLRANAAVHARSHRQTHQTKSTKEGDSRGEIVDNNS